MNSLEFWDLRTVAAIITGIFSLIAAIITAYYLNKKNKATKSNEQTMKIGISKSNNYMAGRNINIKQKGK